MHFTKCFKTLHVWKYFYSSLTFDWCSKFHWCCVIWVPEPLYVNCFCFCFFLKLLGSFLYFWNLFRIIPAGGLLFMLPGTYLALTLFHSQKSSCTIYLIIFSLIFSVFPFWNSCYSPIRPLGLILLSYLILTSIFHLLIFNSHFLGSYLKSTFQTSFKFFLISYIFFNIQEPFLNYLNLYIMFLFFHEWDTFSFLYKNTNFRFLVISSVTWITDVSSNPLFLFVLMSDFLVREFPSRFCDHWVSIHIEDIGPKKSIKSSL